jgi:alanine racemase
MGFGREEFPSALIRILGSGALSVEGVCTTLSSAADAEFSQTQYQRFTQALQEAERICGKTLLAHLAHTGGLIHGLTHPGWFIRPGIMLYGYTRGLSAPGMSLRPVLTWKTEIFRVQRYAAGQPIGYSGLYRTTSQSKIALLPVGYSDGLRRSYMERGEVLIHGRRSPLVGRFSMDWCAADVGHLAEVEAGDEVVLIGGQEDEFISAEEMAERSGTIVDDTLVSIAARVARQYQNE